MSTPDWVYPDNLHCLPTNAKTWGDRIEAPRVEYTRSDLCITRAEADAMVLAERERCARIADKVGDDLDNRGFDDASGAYSAASAIREEPRS